MKFVRKSFISDYLELNFKSNGTLTHHQNRSEKRLPKSFSSALKFILIYMWPEKQGLGVQLNYGVYGNGEIKINSSENGTTENDDFSKWIIAYPRICDKRITLNYVQNSACYLLEPEGDENEMFHRHNDYYKLNSWSMRSSTSDKLFIPKEVLKEYETEAKHLDSPAVYDPTFGSLMEFITVTHSVNKECMILVHVSRAKGSVLQLSLLNEQEAPVKSEDIHKDKKSMMIKLHKPENPFSIEFLEVIKQIKPTHFTFLHGSVQKSLIYIRTDTKLYSICCWLEASIGSLEIKVDALDEINASSLEGFDFVDIAYNPSNPLMFASVDTYGFIHLFNLERRDDGLFSISVSTENDSLRRRRKMDVHDPEELSSWRKIIWTKESHSLLAFSRSKIDSLDFQNLSCRKVVTSDTWSRIRDVQLSGISQFFFILTSKEIILLKFGPPIERVISWKHFLDDKDSSLRLHIADVGSGSDFSAFIYSSIMPLILVFSFSVEGERASSARDPFFIERSKVHQSNQHIKLKDFSFHKVCQENVIEPMGFASKAQNDIKLYAIYEHYSDSSIMFSLYSTSKGYRIDTKRNETEMQNSNFKDNSVQLYSKKRRSYFYKLRRKQAAKLYQEFQDIAEPQGSESQVELIQDYAFKLGRGASQRILLGKNLRDSELPVSNELTVTSIVDIAGELPKRIVEVEEFCSMIEQLSNYFDAKGLEIVNHLNLLDRDLSTRKDTGSSKDLESSLDFSKFVEYMESTNFITGPEDSDFMNMSAIYLASSLLRVRTKSSTSSNIPDITSLTLDEEVDNIIKDWNVGFSLAQDTNISTQTQDDRIDSSLPTIKLTNTDKFTYSQDLVFASGAVDEDQSQSTQSREFNSVPKKTLPFNRPSETSKSQKPSQIMNSSLNGPSSSQRRLYSSQTMHSQNRSKKKKKRSGFS